MSDFVLDDYKDAAKRIRERLNESDLPAVLSNRVNIILSALDMMPWQAKIIGDAAAERQRLIDQMEMCETFLDDAGMPHDHHAEERPLSLDERVEALVIEYSDLVESGDAAVSANVYRSAVNGRKEFRAAFRKERARANTLRAAFEQLLDAHIAELKGDGWSDHEINRLQSIQEFRHVLRTSSEDTAPPEQLPTEVSP